jgi:hypothetical protein
MSGTGKLDFSDPAAVADWLRGMRTDLNQADGISRDMLRPERKRELGHALHKQNYKEAWRGIVQAMAYAGVPLDEPPNGDEPPASRRVPRKPPGDGGPPEGGAA